ncbi:hypothetical protein [Thermaurantiacus sp.]
MLADTGEDRETLRMRGILPIIPPRANRRLPGHPDDRRDRDRRRIGRLFGLRNQQRRVATRRARTAQSFESFLRPAAIRLGLRSVVNRA